MDWRGQRQSGDTPRIAMEFVWKELTFTFTGIVLLAFGLVPFPGIGVGQD